MRLDRLLAGFACQVAPRGAVGFGCADITRVITAPQQHARDALYVAVKTPFSDGEEHIGAAYDLGCRFFLCSRQLDIGADAVCISCEEPEQLLGILSARLANATASRLKVIALTGSTGKSSVLYLLAQILREAGHRVATLSSDGLDIEGQLTPASPRVPDAAQIREQLACMERAEVEYALVELSSYQLWHHAAQGLTPLAVALTSFAPRHIGGGMHADEAEYRAAKERLLCCGAPLCILPSECDLNTVADTVVRVGENGDFRASDIQRVPLQTGGYVMRFLALEGEHAIQIEIPSAFESSVQNAMMAIALARALQIPYAHICAALSHAVPPGRMECIYAAHKRLIYIDSCFEPQDLATALKALAPLTKGRLSVLLGSVGGRAKTRRAALARTAERFADHIYLSADDPDFEDAAEICREMRAAMDEPGRAEIIADRETAILRAVRDMRRGDVLLLAGKGGIPWQLIRGERVPLCERDVSLCAAEGFY